MSYLIDSQVDLLRRILQQQAEKNTTLAAKDRKIRKLENEIREMKGIDPEPQIEEDLIYASFGYCSSLDPILEANSLLDSVYQIHNNLLKKAITCDNSNG